METRRVKGGEKVGAKGRKTQGHRSAVKYGLQGMNHAKSWNRLVATDLEGRLMGLKIKQTNFH